MLVSVDRGETRVALLEAPDSGRRATASHRHRRARRRSREPRARRTAIASPSSTSSAAASARSSATSTRAGSTTSSPGLEAAFVDIGLEKNGFLHVDEIVLPGVEAPRRGRGSGSDGRKITDLLKPGQEIVVQVVKDPLKTKGARLSMELTIAGRYMVYAPYGEGVGVSRRLEDKERERLRKQAAKLDLQRRRARSSAPPRTAPSARTSSASCCTCSSCTRCSQKRVEETPAPALVFQEADLSVRVVRDIFSADFERAIVDDHQAAPPARLVLHPHRPGARRARRAVGAESEEKTLFEAYGVEQVLESTLSRRVDLPSGGYLMIDYAEALTVIDVNSGSFIGRGKGARPGGHDHQDQPRGRRRGRAASCACATSAGSSSSTSSTWRGHATATPS